MSNHVTSQLKSIQSPSASCGAREFNHDAVVLGIRSSRMCAAAVMDSSIVALALCVCVTFLRKTRSVLGIEGIVVSIL